jgi:hypothetical protein
MSEVVVDEFTRRSLIARAGALGVAAALAQLPALLGAKGLLDQARAATGDVTRDTLSGLLAFILPGDDEYSTAQGEAANGPGAIGAGTLEPFINALDNFVPASAAGQTVTVPASGGVATLLNDYALQVDPASANGGFLSPFARLSFANKGEVFRRFETDETVSEVVPELKFVAGILPGFVGFMAASEVGVLDPATRELASRPVGWKLSHYSGPAEGHAEFKGYYQGRRKVRGSRRGGGR